MDVDAGIPQDREDREDIRKHQRQTWRGGRKSSLRGRNIFKFEESFSSFRIRIHIPGLKSEGDLVGLFENVRGESRGMN